MTLGYKLRVMGITNLVAISLISLLYVWLILGVQANIRYTDEDAVVLMERALNTKIDVIQVQQWLTDISATRAVEGYADGFDEAETFAKEFRQNTADFLQYYQAHQDSQKVGFFTEMRAHFDEFYSVGKQMAQAYIEGGPAAGNEMMDVFDGAAEAMQEDVEKLVAEQLENVGTASSNSKTKINILLGFVALSALILIGNALYLLGTLGNAIRSIADNVGKVATQLRDAAAQVEASAVDLARSAGEQASSVGATSSSTEEIAKQIEYNTDNARSAASGMKEITLMVQNTTNDSQAASSLSMDARASAEAGVEAMHSISKAMRKISEGSNKVTNFIEVINDITHQTKMLATNAAIEAARAGEQGKGFSVVANEVSKLAENSKAAAKEIAELVQESTNQAQEGSGLATKGEHVLDEILSKSVKVSEFVNSISAGAQEQAQKIHEMELAINQITNASQEQSVGANEIARSLLQTDQTTQAVVASAEQIAASAEELSGQADSMHHLVMNLSLNRSSHKDKTELQSPLSQMKRLPGV